MIKADDSVRNSPVNDASTCYLLRYFLEKYIYCPRAPYFASLILRKNVSRLGYEQLAAADYHSLYSYIAVALSDRKKNVPRKLWIEWL